MLEHCHCSVTAAAYYSLTQWFLKRSAGEGVDIFVLGIHKTAIYNSSICNLIRPVGAAAQSKHQETELEQRFVAGADFCVFHGWDNNK